MYYVCVVLQGSGSPVLPNPHGDHTLSKPLMPIQASVNELLFVRHRYRLA